jgi:hypothetical protein
MIPFFKYTIEENTHFVATDYPDVMEEAAAIKEKLSSLPLLHRTDIFISFFKNHSLYTKWISDNPMVTGLVSSGSLKAPHIEGLFESCLRISPFLAEYEYYIREHV